MRNDIGHAFRPGAGDRVAIAAGSGDLPRAVANELVQAGHRPLIVAFPDAGDWPETSVDMDVYPTRMENFATIVPDLRSLGVTHMVLAGGIHARPTLSRMRPSLALLRIVPRILAAYRKGDDGLLRAVIDHVESYGIRVVGAHEITPDLLAARGTLTARGPSQRDRADMAAARTAAAAIGALDIGQAAIAIGGRAVALEGIEGTDGLLDRMSDLRGHGRLAGKAGGVLVKLAKPGQETRADLPAIGPETVRKAHAAGLAGIAVEAQRTFILDQATTMGEADRLGMFVYGMSECDP